MGSQSQAQAPQQAHARPMATHAQSTGGTANGNALMGGGGGSISRVQSLVRQGSIYSVTLDDLQRSLLEPGQAFGSMNMDDFLKNIWTMEESQAMASAMSLGSGEDGDGGAGQGELGSSGQMVAQNSLVRQPSLARQGSLNLPRQISRKTVDEVWRDIIKTNPNLAPEGGADVSTGSGPGMSSSESQRQTYGEMTLEAFLVKAGVVKDGGLAAQPSTPYSLFAPYTGSNAAGGPSDRENDRGERMGPGSLAATLSLSPANGTGSANGGIPQHQVVQGQVDWLRNIQQQQAQQQAHQQQQQLFQAQAEAYGMKARVGNGGMQPIMSSNGGYTGMASALAPGLGQMGVQLTGPVSLALAPNSPGSHSPASDGVGHSHGNGLSLSPVGNFGVDGSMQGRKRGADGPVEKVVERRQRRMIKNRESAARSRARKQAYTVELEAEVTQLKEENNRLRAQREQDVLKYKKLVLESINANKKSDILFKRLRRTSSC